MLVLFILLLPHAFANPCLEQDRLSLNQAQALSQSQTLPQLGIQEPSITPLGCTRSYRFEGKVQRVDSYYRRDAENLRETLTDYPEALHHIDAYQDNRKIARIATYVGSAGLLLMLLRTMKRKIAPEENEVIKTAANVTFWAGAGLAGGSMIFNLALLRPNEKHISSAVNIYNEKNPDHPIQLEFSTGVVF
jgi:hypothetical protein